MDYGQIYYHILITSSIAIPIIYYWEKICNTVLKYTLKTPGVGSINIVKKGKKRRVVVDTELGKFKIPFYKLPCLEMDVNFFLETDIIDKNVMIPREEFREKYGELSYGTLRRFDTGILTDVVRCEDFFNKKEIFGFIDCLFEDKIFLFHITDVFIDYDELFSDYEKMLDFDVEID